MANKKQKIEFLALIKEVKARNLVSGDKEIKLDLRVVGADTVIAIKLADLKPEEQVTVSYESK